MRPVVLALVLAIAPAMAPAIASAVTVDIEAADPNNGVTLVLDAGAYVVTPVDRGDHGGYTAWNAWGQETGCDDDGANCSRGWLMNYAIRSASLGTLSFVTPNRFETPDLAFPDGQPTTFTLAAPEDVTFLIGDSNYRDNQGGISLDVAVVPLPAALPLLLAGLGALALTARRRRDA